VITQAILSALLDVAAWVVGLFPSVDAPGWLSGLSGPLADVTDHMSGFAVWVPFTAAGNVLVFVMAMVGVALIVKLIRLIVSLFTGGGGGAA
jgi:hypothetical protein